MMRAAAFFLAMIFSTIAFAQPKLLQAHGSTYKGLGDVLSGAKAFYSCAYAWNAAYATSNGQLCNIRRVSDNETCDILAAATGGDGLTASCSGADNGKTLATWLASTSGAVKTAYDQTGNGNTCTESTNGTQPTLPLSGINSLPVMQGSGSQYLVCTVTATAQPLTVAWIAERTGNTSAQSDVLCGGFGTYFNSANTVSCWFGAGCANATATDNAAHAVIYSITGSSSVTYVDGGSTATNPSTTSLDANYNLLGQQVGFHLLTGMVGEAVVYSGTAVSSGQAASMHTNFASRWGTP